MDTAKLRALKEINKMVTLPPARTSPQTEFMSFTKARSLVRTQRLISVIEFKAWKKPVGMPSAPDGLYKNSGWVNWSDFLGKEFLTFTKARALARAQHLTGQVVFHAWKRPMGMPSQPDGLYKNSGWVNWSDFLGKEFLTFTKARTAARAQHFTCIKEFYAWRKPAGIPSRPDTKYKHLGWISWGDFLGYTGRQTEFMSFIKARTLARAQHFTGANGFRAWKRPAGIPSSPHTVYKNSGWISYGDFFGTGYLHKKHWLSFVKARRIVQTQRFTSNIEFKAWKKPIGIPVCPNRIYKKSGWTNWFDFLGKKRRIQ